MYGVQGFRTSGRTTKLAAYEAYGILGVCPECRGTLVSAGEEGGAELACSRCGLVAGRGADTAEASAASRSGPLGSYIADAKGGAPSLRGPAFGLARLNANIIGRGGPLLACSRITARIAEKLGLPRSVAQQADLVARKLLPARKTYGGTIPGVSAYSLLYACRSAGVAHLSHRDILAAYAEAGYRVGRSQLMRVGSRSPLGLPRSSAEELMKTVLAKLQSSERVTEKLERSGLKPRAYFARVFELAKEVAAQTGDLNGFNPRTVAAGSVYLASLKAGAKAFTQCEAAQTLGMAEYTVREFCCRTNKARRASDSGALPVKSGPDLRRT